MGWHALVASPLFGVTLTVGAYAAAVRLWRRCGRHPLLSPVLVAIAVVIAVLELGGISYDEYLHGGQLLSFLLGPATVALAIPLHRQMAAIKELLLPVLAGVLSGSLASILTALLVVEVLHGDPSLAATLAPKSATTPIAMAIAAQNGGDTALAAVIAVLTGILGGRGRPATAHPVPGVRRATSRPGPGHLGPRAG